MRTHAGIAVLVAAAATVCAPAGAARADQTAQDTINQFQSQGYTVTIDKMGTAPISQCVVTGIRNPHTVTQWVPYVGPGLGSVNGTFLVPMVTSKSISVSLDCTGQRG